MEASRRPYHFEFGTVTAVGLQNLVQSYYLRTGLPLFSHFAHVFPTSLFVLWLPWSPASFPIAFVVSLFHLWSPGRHQLGA